MKSGSKYGSHRVINPANSLPQSAEVLSNDMEIYDNEILVDVESLNIDSASFRQLYEEASGNVESMKAKIYSIVRETGKMKNPVTGSGGVLIGRVAQVGDALKNQYRFINWRQDCFHGVTFLNPVDAGRNYSHP